MKRYRSKVLVWVSSVVIASVTAIACNLQVNENKPRMTLFIGVDVSGSFQRSGDYDNAISFLAYYIYGHLNGLGGLTKPRELFVGAIGGKNKDEPKAFHPIHDFQGKDIAQIETNLREWFTPTDTLTDFNSFFQQVARIAKERNLILAPITVMVVSDGVPDVGSAGTQAKPQMVYQKIDLSPMEYLSKNLTLRLTYASPKVGENWREHVPRQRVRMWTVETDVMKGWLTQVQPGVEPANQDRLWKWVQDNVDFRVRSTGI